MQAYWPCHLGIYNLNVARTIGRLLDNDSLVKPLPLVKEGDLVALVQHMIRTRGRETVRVTKVKEHAENVDVQHGGFGWRINWGTLRLIILPLTWVVVISLRFLLMLRSSRDNLAGFPRLGWCVVSHLSQVESLHCVVHRYLCADSECRNSLRCFALLSGRANSKSCWFRRRCHSSCPRAADFLWISHRWLVLVRMILSVRMSLCSRVLCTLGWTYASSWVPCQ